MKILLIIIFLSIKIFSQSDLLLLMDNDVFDPLSIGDMYLWFDGDQSLTTSSWADQSGNSRTMTLYNTPTISTINGHNTVIFNGTDEYGKCSAFTMTTPLTIYIVLKQISWTNDDYILDGNTDGSCFIKQTVTTPRIQLFAPSNGVTSDDLIVGNFVVIRAQIGSAGTNTMQLQVNNGTVAQANRSGDIDAAGFTLARPGAFNNLKANIEVGEILIYKQTIGSGSDDDVAIKKYLYNKWGITP